MTGDTRTTGPAPLDLPPASSLTRRRALGLAAAVGAAGLLAACGGGDDTADPGGAGEQSSGPSEPTTAESSAASTPSSGGGAALVKTAEVPVAGGVVLKDQKVVVTQPRAGEFKAFSAVCTHQACLVGSVSDGAISCPCHGSRFSASDGSVQQGPASRALSEVAVTVEGDSVVEA